MDSYHNPSFRNFTLLIQKSVPLKMSHDAAEKAADHLRVPDLRLAQIEFQFKRAQGAEKSALKKQLLEGIEKYDMASWYEHLCKQNVLSRD